MNYITNISARSFKGRTFSDDLQKLVAITGPNFSGKSARVDAIRLAILGFLPEQGKTNAATFELGDGNRMEIVATLSTGETIRREFWREGDSIKSSGSKLDYKTPLMDAAEYFGLTETQRLEYIAARAEITSKVSAAAIGEELAEVLSAYPTSIGGPMIHKVLAALEKHGIADGIAHLTGKGGPLLTAHSEWNARAKDNAGAIRTLTELKNRQEATAASLPELEAEVAKIKTEIAAIDAERGKLTAELMAANRTKARREELQAFLSQPATDYQARLDELSGKLAGIEKQIEEARLAREEEPISEHAVRESQERAGVANSQVRSLEGEIERNREKFSEIAGQECCPYCKSKRKDWKKIVEDELNAAHDALQNRLKAALSHAKKLADEAETIKGRVLAATDARQKIRQLDSQRHEIELALTRLRAQAKDSAARVESAKAELDRLTVATPDKAAMEENAAKTADATRRMQAAQLALDGARALQQDLKRAQEANELHTEAKHHVDAIAATGKFLKSKQSENIAALFDGLLQSANWFVEGIIATPLSFRDGEIGRFTPEGQFVTHRAFSGTEKALTYIAISAALSQRGALRVVLLDEFGRVDAPNQEKVLERFAQAIREERIDQAIVVSASPISAQGWQSIVLP